MTAKKGALIVGRIAADHYATETFFHGEPRKLRVWGMDPNKRVLWFGQNGHDYRIRTDKIPMHQTDKVTSRDSIDEALTDLDIDLKFGGGGYNGILAAQQLRERFSLDLNLGFFTPNESAYRNGHDGSEMSAQEALESHGIEAVFLDKLRIPASLIMKAHQQGKAKKMVVRERGANKTSYHHDGSTRDLATALLSGERYSAVSINSLKDKYMTGVILDVAEATGIPRSVVVTDTTTYKRGPLTELLGRSGIVVNDDDFEQIVHKTEIYGPDSAAYKPTAQLMADIVRDLGGSDKMGGDLYVTLGADGHLVLPQGGDAVLHLREDDDIKAELDSLFQLHSVNGAGDATDGGYAVANALGLTNPREKAAMGIKSVALHLGRRIDVQPDDVKVMNMWDLSTLTKVYH